MNAFADVLTAAIAAADIACLHIAGGHTDRVMTIAKVLLPLAQDKGVAVLLDNADLAVKLRADGVHLADSTTYREARRILGTDGIVGVACPLERHTAMEVGEAGADYVQFTAASDQRAETLELITWWTEMMTIPSVVAGVFAQGDAAQFVTAGADFLAPDAAIWSAADPVAAIAALLR